MIENIMGIVILVVMLVQLQTGIHTITIITRLAIICALKVQVFKS